MIPLMFIQLLWIGIWQWFSPPAQSQSYQAALVESSSFVLKGSSNLSDFKLVYTGSLGKTINAEVSKNEYEMNIRASRPLNLKVEGFKSTNSFITKDFQKMLNVEIFPDLVIDPISVWQQKGKPGTVYALVFLTIAGCKKTETLALTLKEQKDNNILCAGVHKISLKKYALEAPKKAFGAVHVKDEVAIDMVLNLQFKKTK